MERQISDNQQNLKDKANKEQLAFVSKMVKIFDSSKADKDISNCYERVYELYQKSNQELSNDEALALTLERLKQPKRKIKKEENFNPQQVGDFSSRK